MVQRSVFIGLILTVAIIVVNGQDPPPQPSPTPFRGRAETALEKTRRLDREHEKLQQWATSNLYGQGTTESQRHGPKWRAAMVSLYRRPGKKEISVLEPHERHRKEYAEFLRSKKTGLFKLVPDRGCEVGGKVLTASPECLNLNFPGGGASYSFRLNAYRIRRLADVTLVKKSLIARGVLNGAIFVSLGGVPIEDVGLETPGLAFLSEYRPVKTAEAAFEEAKRFAKGVRKDGFVYGRGVHVSNRSTFAMRSIAYRGKYLRSEAGVVYDELDFDRRRDVIVVFRIIDVEDDGTATIVYKVLRESRSRKLKIS